MSGRAARMASRVVRRVRGGGDAGVTMIELVTAMTIMAAFMGMFTGAVVTMFQSASRNQATAGAASQLNLAFLRLDREIRYASAISAPGTVAGDPYVEYLTTNTGSPLCTELRLQASSGQLQRRSWTQGASPAAGGWIPLASDVSGTQPFTFSAPDDTFNFQRLELNITATAGGGRAAASRQTDVTFTALNTSLSTSSGTVCTEGRSVP